MKFIKKLSEDEFVVKMEPHDGDGTNKIVLAHDYLQIEGKDWYCTNMSGLDAPWAFGNVINVSSRIQIPIRMAQDILENVLTKDREYLKKEHLVRDGKQVYRDLEGASYRYRKDDGTKMIAIYNIKTDEYFHMPVDIYNLAIANNQAHTEEY